MALVFLPQEKENASLVRWAAGVAKSKTRATPALPGSQRTAALVPSSAHVLFSRPKLLALG